MEIPDVDQEIRNKKESTDWMSDIYKYTEERYSGFTQVFTDGSKDPIR